MATKEKMAEAYEELNNELTVSRGYVQVGAKNISNLLQIMQKSTFSVDGVLADHIEVGIACTQAEDFLRFVNEGGAS